MTQLTTLYVNNINEKVSLNKLKPVLLRLFGRYGSIVQLTAHKNLAMKGQAFITYENVESCEKALLKLQGRPIFKKPIHVAYAKSASDGEHRLQGELEAIEKRKKLKEEREAAKKAQEKEAPQKSQSQGERPALTKAQLKQWTLLPPNHVLLLQNLLDDQLDAEVLEKTFKTYSGFQKIRLIKFRKLAFIDFDQQQHAAACLETISHDIFGAGALLTYAKK